MMPGHLLVLALAAAGPEVVITEPEPGMPLFGPIRVVASVYADSQADELAVELIVDGTSAGPPLDTPPFQWPLDLGDENRPHLFEVVATVKREARPNAVAVARLESPAVRVDDTVDLNLRQLYVTVDRDTRRELDLTAEDFFVTDNRTPQKLVTFERGDVPITSLLLVDASISMSGDRLRHALAGATAFAAQMRALDLAKLVLFSDRIISTTPFTSFSEVIATSLANVETHGDTALLDHLYFALRALEERQGRRLVVILSDGIDVVSVLKSQQLAEAAKRAHSIVYWLRTNPESSSVGVRSSWKEVDEHKRDLDILAAVCQGSGGRVIEVARIEDVADAFSHLLAELRDQYVLGYYPNNERRKSGHRWHRVKVNVARRGLTVTTREGYFDF